MSAINASEISALFKPISDQILNGKGKLCLSTLYLNSFNNCLDEYTLPDDFESSFQVVSSGSSKVYTKRDIQFMFDLVRQTINLKIIPDVATDTSPIVLTKFTNIKYLELHKVDISSVIGLQKLRSQLQHLVCCHCISYIGEILERCGGDNSEKYTWNELKIANFSHNKITEIDNSFETTPWLHTLDLSYNGISNANILSCLPNLKHLNLSYNKLDSIPHFRGQICTRLQTLTLRNNFIEDTTGLSALVNIMQLDLSQNSLLEHKSLLCISHLATLQWLNLQGNPLSFHPLHRNQTSSYLHKNTSTTKFVLNNEILSKSEKKYIGTLYPLPQNTSLSSHSSVESNINSIPDRPRRVRNVTIEDANNVIVKQDKSPQMSPLMSSQHLEIKKQVEQLREEFGESWLNRRSGLLSSMTSSEKINAQPYSSTPYETALESSIMSDIDHPKNNSFGANATISTKESSDDPKSENLQFETANGTSLLDVTETVIVHEQNEESDISDGDDIYDGGEENIFLASVEGKTDEVFVVVTNTHISERECTTSKEKARWHINTIVKCELIDDSSNIIKISFDTVRRDRKQRIYTLDESESQNFLKIVKERIDSKKVNDKTSITYQCMKCSEQFQLNKNPTVLDTPSITCPKCESTLIVENA